MEKPNTTEFEQFVIDKVRQMRKEKGISQKELANLLDVSIGFIGQVESSRHRAKYNLNHINELSFVLNCSPQEFLPKKGIKNKIKK